MAAIDNLYEVLKSNVDQELNTEEIARNRRTCMKAATLSQSFHSVQNDIDYYRLKIFNQSDTYFGKFP